jgi:uncharacterized protein (TIGR02145 family)
MKIRFSVFVIGSALLLVSCSKFPLFQDNTFTDTRDNHEYKQVKIGKQTWMAENLAFLPEVSPSAEGSESIPYYYVYDYQGAGVDEAGTTGNYNTYGVLYNWAAAKISCPSGWHLPDDEEWQTLSDYLDKGVLTVGNKMKETGTSHWNSPNDKATNRSGFTGLPGGERSVSGGFSGIGDYGEFWSMTIEYTPFIKIRALVKDMEVLVADHYDRANGFSVRCLKD